MKKNPLYISLSLVFLFFYSCMPDPQGEGEYDKDSATQKIEDQPAENNSALILNAKFVSFEMGDASHFTFEDSTGKIWDFGGSEAKDTKFAMEVPQDKQNETNQGWTSNPDLKGKWFSLKYVYFRISGFCIFNLVNFKSFFY